MPFDSPEVAGECRSVSHIGALIERHCIIVVYHICIFVAKNGVDTIIHSRYNVLLVETYLSPTNVTDEDANRQ